jgi:YrhK-like protein
MPNEQHRHRTLILSNQRVKAGMNITAATLFVIGCIGFYSPRLHTSATTVFLAGSVLFLVNALCAASTSTTQSQPQNTNQGDQA